MNNLVTVFTPLYNRKSLLPRLYESLGAQTCADFEWVICDDCSTDGSYELAQEFAKKRRPLSHPGIQSGTQRRQAPCR